MAGLIDFQNEEEVKQFLNNIGIEYSYQCHKEKDPEDCLKRVKLLFIQKSSDSHIFLIKTNSKKILYSGHYLNFFFPLLISGGIAQDLKAAYDCFLKSCAKGGKKSIDACHNVGLLAHDGRALGNKPDPTVARDYYTKACNGSFAASCFNLSALYLQGAPGIPKDMSQALKYSLRACDLGHIWGCANASRIYKLGDGTAKDDAKAEALKNRARALHTEQQKASQQLKFG
uniref:Cytochrome c oxidase assembly factor 7 n=1 Tax=Latimeria chalumnae TaxID=7897 RepID=H3A7C9_LATCH